MTDLEGAEPPPPPWATDQRRHSTPGRSTKNVHFRILKTIATSGFLTVLECTKFVFGRGSAPDPAGRAYSAPQTPQLVQGGPYF